LAKKAVTHLRQFGLICPKDFVSEFLWFVQKQLCKTKPFAHVFVLFWTLSFNLLTEACRVWGVVLGLPAISLSITQSDLGVNLLGRPLMRRLVSVLNVFHLWIIFLTVNDGLQIVLKWPCNCSQIDGSNNCFYKIIADVFSLALC